MVFTIGELLLPSLVPSKGFGVCFCLFVSERTRFYQHCLDLYPERVVAVAAFPNLTSTWRLASKLGIKLMKLVDWDLTGTPFST